MVNAHIAWYLFLAGMGGGAFLIGAVIDLALRLCRAPLLEEASRITDRGLSLGPVAVALGSLFLVADLGAPERALQVFLGPPSGILSWGAWSIALFLAASVAAYALGRVASTQAMRVAETVCHATATLLAAFVVGYSGVYLSIWPSVPFLNTPVVPVLFVISALSGGMALLLAAGLVFDGTAASGVGLDACVKVELALIVADLATVVALLVRSWLCGTQTRTSVEALLFGGQAGLFWLGVLCVGVVAPLLLAAHHRRHPDGASYAAGALCSAAGGLCLRFALLLAAVRFSAWDMEAVTFWG